MDENLADDDEDVIFQVFLISILLRKTLKNWAYWTILRQTSSRSVKSRTG